MKEYISVFSIIMVAALSCETLAHENTQNLNQQLRSAERKCAQQVKEERKVSADKGFREGFSKGFAKGFDEGYSLAEKELLASSGGGSMYNKNIDNMCERRPVKKQKAPKLNNSTLAQ